MGAARTRQESHAVSKSKLPINDGALQLTDDESISRAVSELGYPLTYVIDCDGVSEAGTAINWHTLSSRIRTMLGRHGEGSIKLKGMHT